MAPIKKSQQTIEVPQLDRETAEFFIVGETPLIFNQMSEKAKRSLLMPPGRKTAAQKATTLKHVPIEEFRNSVYTLADETAPTLLGFPATAIKKAMANAAVDIPGATKAAIGRLVRVHEYRIPVYGTPQVFTTVVRSADASRTPDIRTRAIVPEWALTVTVSFVRPLINVQAIANLLAGAGELIGIGDFRQQKGAGDFGLFRVTTDDDPDFLRIRKHDRSAQIEAIESPEFYDAETEELLTWYDEEVAKR